MLDIVLERIKNLDYNWINKYTIVIILFVVWISFFDKYSLVTQYKLGQTLHELEERKVGYEDQLEDALVEREMIQNNLEKYARENYHMHKDNEQVIVIKKSNKK